MAYLTVVMFTARMDKPIDSDIVYNVSDGHLYTNVCIYVHTCFVVYIQYKVDTLALLHQT